MVTIEDKIKSLQQVKSMLEAPIKFDSSGYICLDLLRVGGLSFGQAGNLSLRQACRKIRWYVSDELGGVGTSLNGWLALQLSDRHPELYAQIEGEIDRNVGVMQMCRLAWVDKMIFDLQSVDLLTRARSRIEHGDNDYICNAIEIVARGNPELREVADFYRSYITGQVLPCGTMGDWLIRELAYDDKHTLAIAVKRDMSGDGPIEIGYMMRLAWLDKLISNIKQGE